MSIPRRPARPVNCWYSPEVRAEVSAPPEFGEPLHHHRPGRHVDTEGQGLGGEDHLQQALGEALLHRLAEGGHQPGVMGGDPRLQGGRPRPVAQGGQIVVVEPVDRRLGQFADPQPLFGRGQPDPVLQALPGGVVAGRPREDEGDGGKHVLGGQVLDHLGASGDPVTVARVPAATLVEDGAVGVGLPAAEQRQHGEPIAAPLGDGEVMMEGHRSVGLHDHPRRAAHRGQPGPEVGGIADRGRETHEAHLGRGQDQYLLPDRTPVGILEVVDLVEDDHGQIVEERGTGEDHVAEDLGGHHHHRRPGLMGHIPGQQPHPALAVAQGQFGELLVGQGLDRRRVEGLGPRPHGPGGGVLGDQGLARSGGGGHQHRLPPVDGVHRLSLKPVGRKGQAGLEMFPEPLPHLVTGIRGGPPDASGGHRPRSFPMRIDIS